jgi:hypothetical protein
MRRSVARVSASRQGLICKSKPKVRTHIVQNLAQQRERLGVAHCARLEFRRHFHDGVAACLTRGERSGVASARRVFTWPPKWKVLLWLLPGLDDVNASETMVRASGPACVRFGMRSFYPKPVSRLYSAQEMVGICVNTYRMWPLNEHALIPKALQLSKFYIRESSC